MTHQEYVDSIKSAALSLASKFALGYIYFEVPWLNTIGLKQITEFIVNWVLKITIDKTEFGIFFFYIDLRTSGQRSAFDAAAIALAKAKKEGTNEEIKAAEATLIDVFRKFAKFTN